MHGKIVSINISEKKGVRKKPVDEVLLKTEFGIEGDAHASSEWHRQVSLLAQESIEKMIRIASALRRVTSPRMNMSPMRDSTAPAESVKR